MTYQKINFLDKFMQRPDSLNIRGKADGYFSRNVINKIHLFQDVVEFDDKKDILTLKAFVILLLI